mgnify:CR=1 FL=1
MLFRSKTVLASTAGVNGRVFRDRWEALARNEMPAIVVEPQVESDDLAVVPFTTVTQTVSVDILVSGSPLSTLADPIRIDAHRRLMTDQSLGGIAMTIEPAGRTWEGVSGELGVLHCAYAVMYRHRIDDLESSGLFVIVDDASDWSHQNFDWWPETPELWQT